MTNTLERINFSPRIILRVNGEIIEASEKSAQKIAEMTNTHADRISQHIEEEYAKELAKARNPEKKSRLTILVARLAMSEWDKNVFTTDAMQRSKRITTDPRELRYEAKPYWDAVENTTDFLPEIHIRGAQVTEGTSGVWLGVKKLNV